MKYLSRLLRLTARQPLDWWWLMLWYACAYALYRLKLGLSFDTGILTDMHFLPLDALQHDLLRSMLYLHAQPPLMNLLAGIVLKLWPHHIDGAFEVIYGIAGVAAVSLLFHALRRLGTGRWPRMAVCLFLCSFPTLFLYQTWTYSTHLEFCLGCALLYFLAVFYTLPARRASSLVGLFSSGCLLGLLHAQWHIAVFAGLAALMWIMDRQSARRQIALVSLLCLLPLAGWYTKNLVMFGFWGSSSWLGANAAQVAAAAIPQRDILAMKSDGLISLDFPALYNTGLIFFRAPPTRQPPDAIPALRAFKHGSWPNYNYSGVIISSRQDGRDAWVALRRNKRRYLEYVGYKTGSLFRQSSCAYPYVPGMNRLLHADTGALPGAGLAALPPALHRLMQDTAFTLYAVIPACLLLLVLAGKPEGSCLSAPGRRKFVVCGFYLMAAMIVIICALCAFEQTRLRWGMGAFYLAFAAMFLDAAAGLLRRAGRKCLKR